MLIVSKEFLELLQECNKMFQFEIERVKNKTIQTAGTTAQLYCLQLLEHKQKLEIFIKQIENNLLT